MESCSRIYGGIEAELEPGTFLGIARPQSTTHTYIESISVVTIANVFSIN